MAKGRKLTISRSERLLGSYSYSHNQDSSLTDESELGEEDVWSMVDDMGERQDRLVNNSQTEWNTRPSVEMNGNHSIRSRRRFTGDDRQVGGLSLAFEDSGKSTTSSRILHQFRGHDSVAPSPRGHHMATSAPVNVPDWSKILRVESVESLPAIDDDLDDMDPEMIPPHEYLARSRNTAAKSVFEGVGRTLKGRDMSRVRDAVWNQTGFDG